MCERVNISSVTLPFPNPLVGDGAGETGMKSILLGEYNFSCLSKSLSLCKKKVLFPHNSQVNTSLFFTTQKHTTLLQIYTPKSCNFIFWWESREQMLNSDLETGGPKVNEANK